MLKISTGSERARQAKTAGATLAEAGKINESLMYLGQCMQMQSDVQDGNKVSKQTSALANHCVSLIATAEHRSLPTMQTDRTPLLQFLPFCLDD